MELTLKTKVETTTTITIQTPAAFRNPSHHAEMLYIKGENDAIYLLSETLVNHIRTADWLGRQFETCSEPMPIEEFNAALQVALKKFEL
jgi:hypothetical protein